MQGVEEKICDLNHRLVRLESRAPDLTFFGEEDFSFFTGEGDCIVDSSSCLETRERERDGLKRVRVGHDRAYWSRLQPGLTVGDWCAPGRVVGVFSDGLGPPLLWAMTIVVCASQPDTLGQLPEDDVALDEDTKKCGSKIQGISCSSKTSSLMLIGEHGEYKDPRGKFVAVVAVGEVPVLLSLLSDVERFRSNDVNRYLCVDDLGRVVLWVPGGGMDHCRVFALAERQHTRFDSSDGLPMPFQRVRGVRALVSHQVDTSVVFSSMQHILVALTKITEELSELRLKLPSAVQAETATNIELNLGSDVDQKASLTSPLQNPLPLSNESKRAALSPLELPMHVPMTVTTVSLESFLRELARIIASTSTSSSLASSSTGASLSPVSLPSTSSVKMGVSHVALWGDRPLGNQSPLILHIVSTKLQASTSSLDATPSLSSSFCNSLQVFVKLQGSFPTWLNELSENTHLLKSTTTLRLPHHNLHGSLPALHNFEILSCIDFRGNSLLTGSLPSSWSLLATSLQELRLADCDLSGDIPPSIASSLMHLRVIELQHNRFTGLFSHKWSQLQQLRLLNFSHNLFGGALPVLRACKWGDSCHVDISFNKFVGCVPRSWASLAVKSFYHNGNLFDNVVVASADSSASSSISSRNK